MVLCAVNLAQTVLEGGSEDVSPFERKAGAGECKWSGEGLKAVEAVIFRRNVVYRFSHGTDPDASVFALGQGNRHEYGPVSVCHEPSVFVSASYDSTVSDHPYIVVPVYEYRIDIPVIGIGIGEELYKINLSENIFLRVIMVHSVPERGNPEIVLTVAVDRHHRLLTETGLEPVVIVEVLLVVIDHMKSLIEGSEPEVVARVGEHAVDLHVRHWERETAFGLMSEGTFCFVVCKEPVIVGVDKYQIVSIWVYIGNSGAGESAVSLECGGNGFK